MVADHAEFATAAHALDEAFVRHANAGEVDQLVADCYADDAVVLPPNAPLVQGNGQIGEHFREMIEAGAGDMVRETTPLHVVGDLGYGVGTYTLTLRRPGRGPVRDTGKYVLVYRRQADGAWRVAVDLAAISPSADRDTSRDDRPTSGNVSVRELTAFPLARVGSGPRSQVVAGNTVGSDRGKGLAYRRGSRPSVSTRPASRIRYIANAGRLVGPDPARHRADRSWCPKSQRLDRPVGKVKR